MVEITQGARGHGRPLGAKSRRRGSRAGLGGAAVKIALLAGLICLAGSPVAYILWPRWPDSVTLDAPALPISVGGIMLNVPPAAIRMRLQRRAGVQERIDLVFLWPTLLPPDPAAKPALSEALQQAERVFLTIANSDGAPTSIERLKTIYPRYTDGEPTSLPDGLSLQTFRNGTPYQHEDVFFDSASPERFIVRCTRRSGAAPGMCLYERRIGMADVTVRFPRDWINDWRGVANNIDRLIANLQSGKSR